MVALRAVKGALYVSSISVDTGREVLWTILLVIQGCLWRFPFLLSSSRRWDHHTSLHRWQPRLKVSRSRGAYRLLARCEILPRMLFLLVPDSLLPREIGCHSFPPEAGNSGKPAIWCFIVSFFFCQVSSMTNWEKKTPPGLYGDVWSGICLSFCLVHFL